MLIVLNLVAGLIFGAGLILSGMVNPAKVLNFLDVTGSWDASLAFVMIGAIAVTSAGYALARRRSGPLFSDRFRWPTAQDVDTRLILGSAIFGIGWGLVGLCPGPALASLLLGSQAVLVFVASLLVGVFIAARLPK